VALTFQALVLRLPEQSEGLWVVCVGLNSGVWSYAIRGSIAAENA